MSKIPANHGALLAIAFLLLTGCQMPFISTPTPSPTPTELPTQTPLPTIEPTPSPEPSNWILRYVANRSGGPDGVRLFDFNGDGLMDITTSFESSGEVILFLHPGIGSLDQEWPSVVVGTVPRGEDAFGMDVDNDGAFDVVSAHEGDTEVMYVHWAPQDPTQLLISDSWQSQPIPSTQGKAWMYAIPLDVNLDGNTDIVLGAKDDYYNDRNAVGDIGWLEAPAVDKRNLENWIYHTMDHAGWPMSIIAHDVDRDGDPDIVLTDRNSDEEHMGARWLENPGNNWTEEWISHFFNGMEGTRPGFMGMGDFDKDDVPDYVFSLWKEKQIAILNGANNVLIFIGFPNENSGGPKGVQTGDLDVDGNLDFVVTFEYGAYGVGWMNYNLSPFLNLWNWNTMVDINEGKFDQPLLDDVDRDGDLDVLTTEEVQGLGVIWFENPALNSDQ